MIAREKVNGTSLGVIRPARLAGNRVVRRSKTECEEWGRCRADLLQVDRLDGVSKPAVARAKGRNQAR